MKNYGIRHNVVFGAIGANQHAPRNSGLLKDRFLSWRVTFWMIPGSEGVPPLVGTPPCPARPTNTWEGYQVGAERRSARRSGLRYRQGAVVTVLIEVHNRVTDDGLRDTSGR